MPTTRRSVSIKGTIYQRLKLYAEQTGKALSPLVEEIVAEKMDALGIRTFTRDEAEQLRPKNQGTPLARPEKRAVEEKKRREADESPVRRVVKEPGDSTPPTESPIRGGGVHSF